MALFNQLPALFHLLYSQFYNSLIAFTYTDFYCFTQDTYLPYLSPTPPYYFCTSLTFSYPLPSLPFLTFLTFPFSSPSLTFSTFPTYPTFPTFPLPLPITISAPAQPILTPLPSLPFFIFLPHPSLLCLSFNLFYLSYFFHLSYPSLFFPTPPFSTLSYLCKPSLLYLLLPFQPVPSLPSYLSQPSLLYLILPFQSVPSLPSLTLASPPSLSSLTFTTRLISAEENHRKKSF